MDFIVDHEWFWILLFSFIDPYSLLALRETCIFYSNLIKSKLDVSYEENRDYRIRTVVQSLLVDQKQITISIKKKIVTNFTKDAVKVFESIQTLKQSTEHLNSFTRYFFGRGISIKCFYQYYTIRIEDNKWYFNYSHERFNTTESPIKVQCTQYTRFKKKSSKSQCYCGSCTIKRFDPLLQRIILSKIKPIVLPTKLDSNAGTNHHDMVQSILWEMYLNTSI